jgi:hypothetical protein
MHCGHLVESCGSEWFQSALTATISTTSQDFRQSIDYAAHAIEWHEVVQYHGRRISAIAFDIADKKKSDLCRWIFSSFRV